MSPTSRCVSEDGDAALLDVLEGESCIMLSAVLAVPPTCGQMICIEQMQVMLLCVCLVRVCVCAYRLTCAV